MTERHGAFWFKKSNLFVNKIKGKDIKAAQIILSEIKDAVYQRKDQEYSLNYYYSTYSSPDLPPSWIIMELLSLGTVSRLFSLLVPEERKAIAHIFKIKERYLTSWIWSLTYVRNLCAHHAQLWNRTFTVKVKVDKRYAVCRERYFTQNNIYSQAVIVAILLQIVAPDNHWEVNLKNLFDAYTIKPQNIGFPDHWAGFNFTL